LPEAGFFVILSGRTGAGLPCCPVSHSPHKTSRRSTHERRNTRIQDRDQAASRSYDPFSLFPQGDRKSTRLISNASDAIDRARYESLTDADIQENDQDWTIRITADKEHRTLTVADNGIGMTKDEAVEALGTIARSGTKEFLKALKDKDVKDNPELIGQFGVGFYSSFMVADRITVLTRKAGSKDHAGVKWESAGDGSFTVEDVEKSGKGTEVILHLREDESAYLDEWQIRDIVHRYSDFIEHPIIMQVETSKPSALDEKKTVTLKEDVTLNSQKAIWLRDKSEVTADEYNQFYEHVAHDPENPLRVVHYRAEGTSEFTALLFIPSRLPFNIFYRDYKMGPMLYVKRVRIMDHCEALLPPYLRFVKGVVDSSDLPLNVSREMLQNNRQVEIIKNSIIKKVLDTLGDLGKDEPDTYLAFYRQFGNILKEGIYYDFTRKEIIADLLMFASTKSDKEKPRTLQQYVDDMKEGQEHIYYLPASSYEEAVRSPYLEAFRAKDFEVLIMLDEVDEIVMTGLSYKNKELRSIVSGDVDLDKSEKTGKEEAQKKFQKLIDLIRDELKDEVKDVRLSGRLKESPCLLVSDEGGVNPQMEKILKAMGQNVPESRKILEINADHRLFEVMNALFERDAGSPVLREYVGLLYDQALLLEGSKPKDPAAFTKALSNLMADSLK
jgi:molecular chaperone HtpG